MARWIEIVLTLVLFTAAMSVVGWVVNATVPGTMDWLNGALGQNGAWALIVAVWLAAGAYAWIGHRKPGTKPNGM